MKKRFDHLAFIISEFRYIPAEIIAQAAITVTAFNARSLKNKLASFKHALNKKKVDVCIINELNAPFPPEIRGYSILMVHNKGYTFNMGKKKAPVMMGSHIMEESPEEKYLGDMVHTDGLAASILSTINKW